jgi:POT family proton-dependent oligopeptide transporter
LAKDFGWHYGFAAAGVGMVLGLIQFKLTRRHLGEAGVERGNTNPLHPVERYGAIGITAAAVLAVGLGLAGVVPYNPVALAEAMTWVLLIIAFLYFAYVFFFFGLTRIEKERVGVILVLFLASAVFWAGFEQAGSSFNLFAERFTDRTWGILKGWEVPAPWFQSLGPVFIILFAPMFAGLWVWLARRNADPSIPVKFGLGLLLLAGGFLVMAGASAVVAGGDNAMPVWLISTFLVHTFGELCLSPVGLSSVTKLAPRKLVGQMMGTWFLATSLGNLIAGRVAGEFKVDALEQWPKLYLSITILPALTGILLILFARPISRLMVGVK